MIQQLLNLFRHKHRYYVVVQTYHCEFKAVDSPFSRSVTYGYYSYNRVCYDYCIECGEPKPEMK